MPRDPFGDEEVPDLETVLDALDDEDCRAIIESLEGPMTAAEISDRADIPTSTTYRKLDRLTEAMLLAEGTEVRSDGHHTTRYRIDFSAVEVALSDGRTLEISVERPKQTADERLASMWGQVRKET